MTINVIHRLKNVSILVAISLVFCIACRNTLAPDVGTAQPTPSGTPLSPTERMPTHCGEVSLSSSHPDAASLIQGVAILCAELGKELPSANLDLDTGTTGDATKADVAFTLSKGSAVFAALLPQNGATALPIGNTLADKTACEREQSRFRKGSIPEITSGSNICVLTTEGHLAMLRIQPNSPTKEFRLQFSFTTWR